MSFWAIPSPAPIGRARQRVRDFDEKECSIKRMLHSFSLRNPMREYRCYR